MGQQYFIQTGGGSGEATVQQGSGVVKVQMKPGEPIPASDASDVRPPAEPRILDASTTKMRFVGGRVESLDRAPYVAGVTERGTDPLDNGRDQLGKPLSRAELTLDSLVDFGGSTRVRELVGMGVLAPDPQNGGYKWTGKSWNESEKAAERAEQHQREDVQRHAEPLSQQSEGIMRAVMDRLGPVNMTSIWSSYMEGGDGVALKNRTNEFASRMHVEPHEFTAAVEHVRADMEGQAWRAIGVHGEAERDQFTEWCWKNRPNEIREALSQQFMNADTRPLKKLGQEYRASGDQFSDADVLAADFGPNVRVWRDTTTGKAVIAIPGKGSMLFRDAVREGLVRVSTR